MEDDPDEEDMEYVNLDDKKECHWRMVFEDNDGGVDVKTTGLHRADHAVETMDAISQVLSLLVKIYLDEIDKLGNYESISP